MMNLTSPPAFRRRIAFVKRVLPVLLLVVAGLVSPATGGIAWADGSQDPPALISADDAKSAGLKAQIGAYDESVAAQQNDARALLTEKATLRAQVAKVNAVGRADDAAGTAIDQQFAELNSAIQAYNDAGPPGDPAYADELDAEVQQLSAQQAQNNVKIRADNAEKIRLRSAGVAHNRKVTNYENKNQQLTAERATLMAQILAEQAAAELTIIATLTIVDSLRGMDSPQPDQRHVPDGGDNTAPATLSSCSHSFAAGTQVLMAAGTTEPIQDVHVGDLVENAQPGGGNEVHKVDQVHVTTTDTDFTRLTVSTPNGLKTITGTRNHPYYDQSIGAFVNAANLKHNDRLQSIETSTNATVLSIENYTGHMVTYDLTIDGLHTYYVEAGTTPVLVHNSDCMAPMLDDKSEAYVRMKHFTGGPNLDKTKGVFNDDVDLDHLAERASRFPPSEPNNHGFYERVVNYGSPVGETSARDKARQTSWFMLVQDKYGGVITMYPIPPR